MDEHEETDVQKAAPIKTENVSGESHLACASPDNASSLTIDSDDDFSNENEDENFEAWRATERRLSTANDSEVYDCEEDLGINMENKNTQRKTDTDIRIFITYLRSINEFRGPELVQPVHLDRYLSAFFSVVKKHDGNEYEPASLRGMLCSVERYLKLKNYPQSVTRDCVFIGTRNALKYKQQKLRELGKGSKKQPEPFGRLTLEKVNHLFSAHEMGPYTPMSVINTLCFLFIVHFRLRKAIDHKNLLWGDIKLKTNQNGKKYMIYEPVDVQNSIAHSKYDHHGNRLCIWEQPEIPERDPVAIYKLYEEKRPQNMKYENSPFYLGITSMQPIPLQSWYRTCAMGVNKLSDLVRMIRDITGLPRATMNAPTEFILSESYGMVSSSKQDKVQSNSSMQVTDPKHSKIFCQTFDSPTLVPDRVKTEIDLSDKDMNDRPTLCSRLSEDSYQNDVNSEGTGRDMNGQLSDETEDSDTVEEIYGTRMLSLIDAKTKVRELLQRLDENDRMELKKWTSTLNINTLEDSETEEATKSDVKPETATPIPSFPSITLNIKISPDALTGGNPLSVVADFKPVNEPSQPLVRPSGEKRKTETIENDGKRLKDIDSRNPMNLTSESSKRVLDKTSKTCEKFKNVGRMSGSSGNTAVVFPRSDKINSETVSVKSQNNPNCESINANATKTGSTKIMPRHQSNSENLGYIVPISYPYIGPNCFSQDPRVLMNAANVIPQMAHSGANTPFSFIQSTFGRSAPKAPNQQDLDNNNERFG